MHFTYKSHKRGDLCQGDVLRPTDALRRVLRAVHPHFDDPAKYPRFMVLTQTCDLVRRHVNRLSLSPCKSPYISLAAVRPLKIAVSREVAKFQHSHEERQYHLCGLEYQDEIRRFLERLLNNNQEGYFYLHDTGDDLVPEPMCVFLQVSIALRSRDHYDTCRLARVIGLTPEFQAKLGWLVGQSYSRIATEDWSSKRLMAEMEEDIKRTMNSGYAWPDRLQMKQLKKAIAEGQIDGGDPNAVADFIATKSSKKELVLDAIESHLAALPEFRDDRSRLRLVLRNLEYDPVITRFFGGRT